MRRDEIVRQLRMLPKLRAEVEKMESALAILTEQERDIIGTMLINPVPLASEKMCEKLMIERSAVYRRRDKAMIKLEKFLTELRDENGTTTQF